MPYKIQHTAASLQQKMLARYGDEFPHKHNKNHLEYRKHWRSHPCSPNHQISEEVEESLSNSTGQLREHKLRKMRKRPNKGNFH